MTEQKKAWDIAAIANALRAETAIAYHPAEGPGIRFTVGYSYTKLDLWPQTGHLHLLTPSLTFDAYRMWVAGIDEDAVLFGGGRQGSRRWLWIVADGNVFFHAPGTPDRSYDFPGAALRPGRRAVNGAESPRASGNDHEHGAWRADQQRADYPGRVT
jgi:hypothetical protein